MSSSPNDAPGRRGPGMNLLRFRPIRWLFFWPGYPYLVQAAFLAAFLFLAALGWGLSVPDGVKDKLPTW